MVAAEDRDRGQRTPSERARAHTHTNSHTADKIACDTRTQLAVSDAHVALQQIVNLLDGLFLECGRLE